jgi:hypothetical protein
MPTTNLDTYARELSARAYELWPITAEVRERLARVGAVESRDGAYVRAHLSTALAHASQGDHERAARSAWQAVDRSREPSQTTRDRMGTPYLLACGHYATVPGPHGATTGRAWCDTCNESSAIAR